MKTKKKRLKKLFSKNYKSLNKNDSHFRVRMWKLNRKMRKKGIKLRHSKIKLWIIVIIQKILKWIKSFMKNNLSNYTNN